MHQTTIDYMNRIDCRNPSIAYDAGLSGSEFIMLFEKFRERVLDVLYDSQIEDFNVHEIGVY